MGKWEHRFVAAVDVVALVLIAYWIVTYAYDGQIVLVALWAGLGATYYWLGVRLHYRWRRPQ